MLCKGSCILWLWGIRDNVNPAIDLSTMSVNIRLIEKIDNAALANVVRTVLKEFKIDLPGTAYTDPTTDDIFKLFQKPGSQYWVAEEDGRILGGCGIFATEGLPEGCGEMVKLYLLADARGRGIGKKLMQKSLEEAKNAGYKKIYIETMPELERSIQIYEKAGFERLKHPLGSSGHYACTIWMLKDL